APRVLQQARLSGRHGPGGVDALEVAGEDDAVFELVGARVIARGEVQRPGLLPVAVPEAAGAAADHRGFGGQSLHAAAARGAAQVRRTVRVQAQGDIDASAVRASAFALHVEADSVRRQESGLGAADDDAIAEVVQVAVDDGAVHGSAVRLGAGPVGGAVPVLGAVGEVQLEGEVGGVDTQRERVDLRVGRDRHRDRAAAVAEGAGDEAVPEVQNL